MTATTNATSVSQASGQRDRSPTGLESLLLLSEWWWFFGCGLWCFSSTMGRQYGGELCAGFSAVPNPKPRTSLHAVRLNQINLNRNKHEKTVNKTRSTKKNTFEMVCSAFCP